MSLRIKDGFRIPALDGFHLAATCYEPEAAGTDKVVLINSATAVRRRYYDAFARFLAGEGFTVLTYDYRGIGDSRPRSLVGFRAWMHQWAEDDQEGVLDWIAGHLRPARLLVVGHSVGGQIVGLADNNSRINGMLGVAAQNGYWGNWPSPKRYWLALRWHTVPVVSRLFGYVPGWLGVKEDLPDGVAREWAAWCRRPGFMFEDYEERRWGFESFEKPILAYSFEDDAYAPRRAVESLLETYRNARITHRHIVPQKLGTKAIGHFGFFRERFKETLWREAAGWLTEQAAA
jgi:predicted alpha/beta hydrolase